MISGLTSLHAAAALPQTQKQPAAGNDLTAQEQRQVEVLKRTDAKVRAHEAAHVAAGGGVVRGGASLQYTQGPDGKRYAVAGEVGIDSSAVAGDPQATIRKAETIRRAALAPADPSAQDRKVAAQASQMVANARMELTTEGDQSGDGTTNNEGRKAISQYRQSAGDVGTAERPPLHLVA